MNRIDLQELSKVRLIEAHLLLTGGCWDGAYYLAGYAVECAFKACFAKLTSEHQFPDKQQVLDAYTHDLARLLRVTELELQFSQDSTADPELLANWDIVRRWSESARYIRWSQRDAEILLTAINDSSHGVFSWITQYW